MASQSMAERLAQMSPADKQRLLAHLLREKARQQAGQSAQPEVADWIQDSQLDPGIQPVGPALHCGDPHTILLTGATGFLGAHLLHELCNRTTAAIYCLVRARDV